MVLKKNFSLFLVLQLTATNEFLPCLSDMVFDVSYLSFFSSFVHSSYPLLPLQ